MRVASDRRHEEARRIPAGLTAAYNNKLYSHFVDLVGRPEDTAMGEQSSGMNGVNGAEFDGDDLLALHEDILGADEEGLRQLLREFSEDGLSLAALCHLEAELDPLEEDHDINKLPLSALHRAVLLNSTSILSLVLNCDPQVNINLPLKSNGFSLLHVAAVVNNTAAASYLASNGAKVNVVDTQGQTPIHVCAKFGFVDIAMILVVRGASLDIGDIHGNTPLHVACEAGHMKFVSFLLKKGVDVNAPNHLKQTPLHRGQVTGQVEVTSVLLGCGASVNERDEVGRTALHFLVENAGSQKPQHWTRYHECFSCILQSADPNLRDSAGNTVLHTSCLFNFLPALQTLLQRGRVDVNAQNATGTVPVAMTTSILVLRRLLLCDRINVGIRDSKGDTAFHHYSANRANLDMLVTLAQSGAGVNDANKAGETPLFVACKSGFLDKVQALVKLGGKLDILSRKRQTLLHACLVPGHMDVAKHIVTLDGVDLDTQDDAGSTALHLAIKVISDSNYDLVRTLIEKGANANLPDHSGRLPADLAVSRGLMRTLHFLLASGAHLNDVTNTNLLQYVHNSDLPVMQQLLRQGMSPQLCNSSGETFLHLALFNNSEALATVLANHGASCNTADKNGCSPLHMAARHCHSPDIFRLLTSRGGSVNHKNHGGFTPLHNAVLHNTRQIVDLFVNEFGAKLDLQDGQKCTPLHSCAIAAIECDEHSMKKTCGDFVAKFQLLLFRVATNAPIINTRDASGSSLLHYAAELGDAQLVQLLLQKAANTNVSDNSGRVPLHFAATNGNCAIVTDLLKRKAEVDRVDAKGHSALHHAIAANNDDVVNILLDYGANVNIKRVGDNCTALHLSLAAGNADLSELLLLHGVDVSTETAAGQTSLHVAVVNASPYIVQLILGQSPDVHARDSTGSLPIHHSTQNVNTQVLKKLIDAESDINGLDRQGNTPLIMSAKRASYDHMTMLLEYGADVDRQNQDGACALHYAAMQPETDLVELLIANNAEVDSIDSEGRSPLMWAVRHNNADAALVLLEQGADSALVDSLGETVLHQAVRLVKVPTNLVRSLVHKGCDFHQKNSHEMSPLNILQSRSDVDLSDLLQALGVTE